MVSMHENLIESITGINTKFKIKNYKIVANNVNNIKKKKKIFKRKKLFIKNQKNVCNELEFKTTKLTN